MIQEIRSLLHTLYARHLDSRLNVFKLEIDTLTSSTLALSGQVLQSSDLQELTDALTSRFPALKLDLSAVKVLRQPTNPRLTVCVNLTSLHREPDWLSEQLSQLLYGTELEVLEERGRWVFVRQQDGYLGWAYRLYLSAQSAPEPDHILCEPLSMLRAEPDLTAGLNGRLLIGTRLRVTRRQGAFAYIEPHPEETSTSLRGGWILAEHLRPLASLPMTLEARQKAILADAFRMLGTMYLWGGSSAFGIDCSGLAQLCHRLSGIQIPRDADLQMTAGRPVEFPYRPGDLVFFGEDGNSWPVTHVAISLGGWNIIHSTRSRNGVYTDDIQTVPHLRASFLGGVTYLD